MQDLLLHVALPLKTLRTLFIYFLYIFLMYMVLLNSAPYFFYSLLISIPCFVQSFILVHQTFARFSRSFLWPKHLSLKTVMSIMRTGQPTLMKLIDQVTFVIFFLFPTTLIRLTSLLGSLIVTPAFVLHFHWRVVIILPCLSLH